MIIKPEAAQDIIDTVLWYERQREGLGKQFQARLDQVLEQIERMPELHRLYYKRIRRVLTPRYPFAVYYRIDNEQPVILAVVHSRRDLEYWKSRL